MVQSAIEEKKPGGQQQPKKIYARLWKGALILLSVLCIMFVLRGALVVVSLYEEASPNVRIPYVELNLYALAKFQLLSWGWKEEGIIFNALDKVSDDAYQRGLAALPEGDGEKYIWYYLRYFYYYPDLDINLLRKVHVHKEEVFQLAVNLANAPIANSFIGENKRYDVVGILLGAHLVYLDKYRSEVLSSLRPSIHEYHNFVAQFSNAFYRSLPTLINISQWFKPHTNYFFIGMHMAQGNTVLSSISCESPGAKTFRYVADNTELILQKMTKESQDNWNKVLSSGMQNSINQLTQKCHF